MFSNPRRKCFSFISSPKGVSPQFTPARQEDISPQNGSRKDCPANEIASNNHFQRRKGLANGLLYNARSAAKSPVQTELDCCFRRTVFSSLRSTMIDS